MKVTKVCSKLVPCLVQTRLTPTFATFLGAVRRLLGHSSRSIFFVHGEGSTAVLFSFARLTTAPPTCHVQATALGVVGDTIAQRLERRRNPGQRYEFKRTVHAGLLNMLIDGVFTPHWYNLVDYINDEMTLAVSVVKAVAASVLYSPFANGLFLAGAWVLSYGMKAGFGWREWKRQLAVCTIRDLEMWPPLHILNFWLVPKHWRPLAGHLAGVVLLAVISTTGLTDAALPLGQRTAPLLMRWARAIGDRLTGKGRRAAGAPPAQRG
ncbi:unnamed protein product [Scytosiphon promiscuus]